MIYYTADLHPGHCIGFTPLTLTQIINFYGERKRND